MKAELTKKDTALLKGFAILCIILHNFCHWLPVIALENEYKFYLKRTYVLVDFLNQGQHVIMNLFSYFGHYGVPLFIFLSGYGLVKKYEKGMSEKVGVWDFIYYNAKKLWHLLWIGFLLWLISDLQLHDWHETHRWFSIAFLLTYIANLFPRHDLLMGPWWFFSLIMQLYFIYRVCFYRRGKTPLILVTLACIALLVYALTLNDRQQELLNYLRYNFVGSMLPFAMGIWMARYGLYYHWKLTLPCLVLFVACCFNKYAWLLTPVFFTIASLPLADLRGHAAYLMQWVGGLSSVLFVIHPIVRAYFINWINTGGNWYLGLFGYLLVCFLLALVYRHGMNLVPRPTLGKWW